MAKIALGLEQALAERALNGCAGGIRGNTLAKGDGWRVRDVICTSGPRDRCFEERHSNVSIAIVTAGSFQYRSDGGHELMTPGSLLLGAPGQYFECGHEHGTGDRCLSFQYTPEHFESLAAGVKGCRRSGFRMLRLPALRPLAPFIARACGGMVRPECVNWEEFSITLAAETIRLTEGLSSDPYNPPPGALARVTRAIRTIERDAARELTLGTLARTAGLTPYHFLRTFQTLTGLTPHQYVSRTRLREAAVRLGSESGKILDVALDCGFGDVSNFNRAFRAEFALSPRAFRRGLAPVPARPA